MSAVVWLNEALEDLKSIGDYIAQENANAAYNILIRIKATTDNLLRHPEIVRPGCVFGTREIVMSDLPHSCLSNNRQRYSHIGCHAYIQKMA